MASKDTYAKKSLIDIANDSFIVDAGTVTRSDGGLNLGASSRCTFTKNYTKDDMSADKLKVDYSLLANEVSSRYNDKITIQLRVQYYETSYDNGETQYTAGKWQTIDVIPYTEDENKGNYKFDAIETEGRYIKTLKCVIRNNNSNKTARLNKLGVYNSIYNPNEVANAISEYTGSGGTLDWVFPTVYELPDNPQQGYACLLYSVNPNG